MKIAFNPSTVEALIAPPNNKDITFDLRGHNIFARGVKFCGTDTNTWRDIKINNVSIDSNILDLRDGDNTTLTNINGIVTINSTWRPVVDNLTSDSTTSSLSANQGRVLKDLIDGKSDSDHNHDDRYLRLTGGTMASNALITFADSGSWSTGKGPQGARGGLYWTGQSDYTKLYAEETAEDNLDLVIQFGDDNSNGLSIRNASNVQTSYISAVGVITTKTFKGNLDWSYITNKPATATRWPSWDEIANKPNTFTPSDHNHDYLIVNAANEESFNSAYHNFQVLYAGGDNGIAGRPSGVDAFGLIKLRAAYGWSGQMLLANGGSLYIRSSEDANMTSTLAWRTILDSSNYSSILDSRYYTESEIDSLLDAKLNRQNLSYGAWNPRGYNLAAGYYYNGGDLSISESGGQIHVSVDGYFWQNEGQYRVLDTSDVAGLKNNLTVHQHLSNTDTTWYPLIWGGSSHNNTSDSTGEVYKSYDKLSWQTSSQTLYATNLYTGRLETVNNHYYHFNSDATLRIYGSPGGNTERIYFQAGIDNRIDDYDIPSYGGEQRHSIILNPRGGFVGIGNTNPSYKLSVGGDIGTGGNIYISHSTNNNMNYNTSNPRIVFSENGTQAVGLVYTDYDSYRRSKGLKVMDVDNTDTGNVWFEVQGYNYSSGYVKNGSNDSYVLLGGGGHKVLSDFAFSSHSHNYAANENYGGFTKSGRLPISGFYQSTESESGGNAPWTSWMHLINCQHNNTDNNFALQIAASFYDNNTFKIRVTDNNVNNAWRDIIHSGNIGSQSVNYANSAGNADTVDGEHASNFSYTHQTSFDFSKSKSGRIVTFDQSGTDYGWINGFASTHSNYLTSIIFNTHRTSNWYVGYIEANTSTGITEGLTAVKQLAFLDSKVADSDKLDGIHANGLLTALSNSNNGISITVGGTTKSVSNISVNYASSAGNADTVDGYHASYSSNTPWGTIPVITTQGYMDIGIDLEFHCDNSTGSDYSTALMCQGNYNNIVYLPSASGTLALTSDIPTVTNYYWANVKISASSSTTTSPTVSNLTATSSIKMSDILLEHTNEINSTSGLHLNYRTSNNVTLCIGGGKVGIGTTTPSYKLDVNGQMRASGFHHGSVNSDNYILLAGGGYTSFGGDSSHPIFLGYLNLEHGNDGTISSSFYCLGYSVSFTYTRGGNYCKIYIPDTSYQTFHIRAATASVNYSGGGMDTWTGYRRGEGAWWLHCYAYSSNEVRVKGFRQANDNNDSWWGGNPLYSGNGGANRITVCIFGCVTFR